MGKMRYDFSAQFLRVQPPDTSFGEAWESLCYDLLSREVGAATLVRLRAPDRGVDILHRPGLFAYQCKSDERGAFGTSSAEDSVASMKTAIAHRAALGWDRYCFATNANYTGAAYARINEAAVALGLGIDKIEFRGPEYWDNLCAKHFEEVRDRFDYRISATERQVIDAFRAARYFDKYVAEYSEALSQRKSFSLVITNNRTPLEVEIPFSLELSVENYLDVAKELLGISLEWTNFGDLDTSAAPSLSVAIDRKPQPLSAKIGDLQLEPGQKLELLIKIVWQDEQKKDGVESRRLYSYRRDMSSVLRHAEEPTTAAGKTKGEITLDREEAIVQHMIWKRVRDLLSPTGSSVVQ